MTTLNGKSTAAAVLEKVEGLDKQIASLSEENGILRRQIDEVKQKNATALYPPGVNPNVVGGIVGRIPGDSESYSIIRATKLANGMVTKDEAKYEYDCAMKLKKIYADAGYRPEPRQGFNSYFVPFCTSHIPTETSEAQRVVGELKQKMVAGGGGEFDTDEARWIGQRTNHPFWKQKDLGTILDTQGGVLVGFPTLMELIDVQRNIEVFPQAGATEQALPANGRMQYPKLTNVTSAFWVGEGATITESTPATGFLDLQAKKLGLFVDLNNELIRFASVTAEGMTRRDMGMVAALKLDLAMLEGTGGTQIKGLITYPSAASWTTGTDPLLAYTVSGNLFQINDAADMEALLPDTAGSPTAWIMRRNMWAKIRNRRFGASTASDAGGGYLVNFIREFGDNRPLVLDGTKVVRSTQVSNTRGGSTQTYIILGYFPDWIIARFGVLEFLSSNVSDQAMTNDQTRLRCIQHVDAGPRHASSFVFADAITIS